VGFEPTVSAGERPQTYSLDRAATGTGQITMLGRKYIGESFAPPSLQVTPVDAILSSKLTASLYKTCLIQRRSLSVPVPLSTVPVQFSFILRGWVFPVPSLMAVPGFPDYETYILNYNL
jgi:hypothetical protein